MDDDEKWQNCIDQLVWHISGPVSKSTSENATDEFFRQAEVQDWPYGKQIAEGFWIKDYNIFDRGEANYLDSYGFDEELVERDLISEKRVEEILEGSKLSDEEYKVFLRWWAVWTLDDPRWDLIHAYDVQELTSTDGRSCFMVMSDQEGDSLHVDLEDRTEGFFTSKEEALEHLRDNGLLDIDKDNDGALTAFIDRVCVEAEG